MDCRTVHKVETLLIRSGKLSLPGKKHLLQDHQRPETVVMGVTQSPIERPQTGQRSFYSGKKRRHTFKSLLVVDLDSCRILCTAHGKDRRHDFKLFKLSGIRLHPLTQGLGDKGFQGMQKLHVNSRIPKKKLRSGQLSAEDRRYYWEIARLWLLLSMSTER